MVELIGEPPPIIGQDADTVSSFDGRARVPGVVYQCLCLFRGKLGEQRECPKHKSPGMPLLAFIRSFHGVVQAVEAQRNLTTMLVQTLAKRTDKCPTCEAKVYVLQSKKGRALVVDGIGAAHPQPCKVKKEAPAE